MIPSGQLLLEENTLLIMQKIINCEILELSSLEWRAERNDVSDNGWNTNEDEDELLAATYNCEILDASLYYMIEDKCPQDRQKKKVVKSKTNYRETNQKQVFAMHKVEFLTHTQQPNCGKCVIFPNTVLEEPLAIQQGENSVGHIHAASVRWKGTKPYQNPTTAQHCEEEMTIEEDMCTKLQAAIGAYGIVNEGEAANKDIYSIIHIPQLDGIMDVMASAKILN
ncbi:uncharacterized protein F5891DRAFT_984026 [Suillus fuscotomentosus]|uniref:Uncharacterized protein n=1 Tax=Suillus fuscotomentosus TaxID=1912939 RepID=A0AAD4HHJ2_9AGAM|nr:uncharacterized protein F5891DRAFT_984026 [Suillus fuscotomentosus]KAG1895724.1 hypothetical protein F5891DRAFT_984026 [Suillus fuscotomentosus]